MKEILVTLNGFREFSAIKIRKKFMLRLYALEDPPRTFSEDEIAGARKRLRMERRYLTRTTACTNLE